MLSALRGCLNMFKSLLATCGNSIDIYKTCNQIGLSGTDRAICFHLFHFISMKCASIIHPMDLIAFTVQKNKVESQYIFLIS